MLCSRCRTNPRPRKNSWCNPCHNAYQREKHAKNAEKWRDRDARAEHHTGRKRCAACATEHPVSAFGLNRSTLDGLSTYCRRCQSAATRKAAFGLDPSQIEALAASQGNACAICVRPFVASARRTAINVDHDHVTGRVRGLLCVRCNGALGALGDTADGLRRALAYLERAGKRTPART